MFFYTMEHRGGLKEAVQTVKEISVDEFYRLLDFYRYYGQDDRIHSKRFIYRWPEKSSGPTWLLMSTVSVDKWRI